MNKKILHLVCNSHIDPVWLWEWQEGLAETLSTFRTAARFCEEFDGFIFCHNESLLYRWVEEYEPGLFERIRTLVDEGRWHIMGGWFLQPDCNVPSGESFVRQILIGKNYFSEKFSVEPGTAINLDPFGHSRGLVQILKKSGFHSYLFCRPDEKFLHLPDDDFAWVGYDGSEIMAHRASDHYNSQMGKARERIERWIDNHPDKEEGLLLWGIGNHGGGPSAEDLKQIDALKKETDKLSIIHSNPEAYFRSLEQDRSSLYSHAGDLNPWAVGCYTSMARVKRKHRQLENEYFATEKICAHALLNNLMEYPRVELAEALEDLLFCEFHDILPGSAIDRVEEYALQRLDHGLEILSRIRTKTFFCLLSGQEPAKPGEFPILVYNPHPRDIDETVVVEFQPPEPNFDQDKFLMPELFDREGKTIPLQLEKESSNIACDQRKRIVFNATLKASTMNRFSCYLKEIPIANAPITREHCQGMTFTGNDVEVVINPVTGLLDHYRIKGVEMLKVSAFRPLVMQDDADPWGMKVISFRKVIGEFELMSDKEAAKFAGIAGQYIKPVRVIESGSVRTVVEALFKFNNSSLCMRYILPRSGTEIAVEVRVYWQEKDRMLKLSIPTVFTRGKCHGQVAYGTEEFDRNAEELVAQQWVSMASEDQRHALTIINDRTYGFDFDKGELRLSLLRSPAHSGHPTSSGKPIVKQDRFEPRIDQGEHLFRFRMKAGSAPERLSAIDREALIFNQPPIALCCYPTGRGKPVGQSVVLSDGTIQLTAVKLAEKDNRLILRFFEPTGESRSSTVSIPLLNLEFNSELSPFEIKTIAIDLINGEYQEVNLLERV